MWLNDFLSAKEAIRPTRPTTEKHVGRPQSVAAVGPSDTSDTSDKKKCIAWLNTEKGGSASGMQSKKATASFERGQSVRHLEKDTLPLTPLLMDWTPDTWEGRPCCYLPHVPERLRGILHPDLQGMGIPAEGLPAALRGFSRSGWRLVLEKGDKLRMVAAVRDVRNEEGCRGYLRVNRAAVLRQLKMWEADQ